MTKPAISIRGLWKEYQIGGMRPAGETFYDVLSNALRRPFRNKDERVESNSTDEKFWALRDINFDIQPGEVVGVIGRNGAGKSTLLKVLSRITAPTRGHVEVSGRLASLLEVGTGFHPELTGRENVFLSGAVLGMTRREIKQRFDEIVAFAEIAQFIDTPVKRYSSGMYVRLAFAVAAHLETDVLIVDEVLAVGDFEFQSKCLGKVKSVSQDGRTVLLVSHNMDAVRRLCNKSAILEKGKLLCFGDSAKLIDEYTSPVSAQSGNSIPVDDANEFDDVKIETIELFDNANRPVAAPRTWEDIRFRVVMYARHALPGVSVVLQISTLSGAVLILCATQPDQTVALNLAAGRNYAECVVRSFPLSAGTYRIGAGVAIPNRVWLVERLTSGLLHVLPNDIYGSGLPPASSRFIVASNYHWEVNGAEPIA